MLAAASCLLARLAAVVLFAAAFSAAPAECLYVKVVDSSTGLALQGATCIVQTADTLKTVATTQSGVDGLCPFPDVRSSGYYQLSVSITGFFNLGTTLSISSGSSFPSSVPYQVQLSSQGTQDKFRVVLSWGDKVKDLDSYMFHPSQCTVSYQGTRCGSVAMGGVAELDVDDTSYFGPETITITGATKGTFAYFVNIYSAGHCFDDGIKANVQIWSDREGGLLFDLDNPEENPAPKCANKSAKPKTCKQFWHVANYYANTGNWQVVNEFVETGGFVSPDQSETKLPEQTCGCSGVTNNLRVNAVIKDASDLSEATENVLAGPLCANHLQSIYNAAKMADHSITSSEFLNAVHQRTEDRLSSRITRVKRFKDNLLVALRSSTTPSLDISHSTACCVQCTECVFDTNFGLEVSLEGACVRYAPQQSFETRKNEPHFRHFLKEMKTWIAARKGDASLKWVFAGDRFGSMYVAPQLHTSVGSCNTFDARLRPWYAHAVAGTKRVTIVLDASSGINVGEFAEAKRGVLSILRTVSSRDQVNIIVVSAEGVRTMGDEATGSILDGFAYQSCLGVGVLTGTSQNIKLINRFVEQISISKSLGAVNFREAIDAAQGMINQTIADQEDSANADGHKDAIVVLAGSSGWESALNGASVTADLFVYPYSGGLTSDVCSPTSVLHCGDGQSMSLTPGLYYLQLDSWHRNKAGDVRLSALYFDALGLGMVTTAAAPVYINGELLGVMGADVPVSEIVVGMNAVASGATSGKKETAAQETLARTPTSYGFVVDSSGVVVWHPLLKLPADLTKEPHAVHIQSLETAPEFNTMVWAGLQADFESGVFAKSNVRITGEYVTARGDSTYSGYDLETRTFTYSWDRLAGTDFAVVVALSDEDRTDKDLLFPVLVSWFTSGQPVFHRIDFYNGKDAGDVTKIALHGNNEVLVSNSAVFLSAKSTSKPYVWLSSSPSRSALQSFDQAVKATTRTGDALKLLPDINLSVAAQSDIRITQRMNECWLDTGLARYKEKNPFGTWAWRYVATPAGVFRMFPGSPWRHSYDPTTRPWYLAAANNFNSDTGKYLYTFSTPYVDGGGAGEVMTLSKGIRGSSTQLSKRDLLAVVALDMTVTVFQEFLFDYVPACKQASSRTCIVINENGFVVYHKDFAASSSTPKEHVFLAEKHARVATWLVNEGVLTPTRCADFDASAMKSTYKVDVSSAVLDTHVDLECGSFVMSAVANTNVFLIEIDGNGCGFSRDFPCLPCNRHNCANTVLNPSNTALLCQPCACQLAFSSCNGTFALGGDEQAPVCPVSPSAQFSDLDICDSLSQDGTYSGDRDRDSDDGTGSKFTVVHVLILVAGVVGVVFLWRCCKRSKEYNKQTTRRPGTTGASAGAGTFSRVGVNTNSNNYAGRASSSSAPYPVANQSSYPEPQGQWQPASGTNAIPEAHVISGDNVSLQQQQQQQQAMSSGAASANAGTNMPTGYASGATSTYQVTNF